MELGWACVVPTNIKIGRQSLLGTNIIAYRAHLQAMKKIKCCY